MEVVLRRNRKTKVILATPEHRWFVLSGTKKRDQHRVETTSTLLPNHRLATLRLPRYYGDVSSESIRMGFVFGDGTILTKNGINYGMVSLWGTDLEAVSKHFDEIARGYPATTEQGVVGMRYHSNMIGYHKNLPPLSADRDYLLGWLMGYFAADGSVSTDGQVTMTSHTLENLEHVRDVATMLGIGTYSITTRVGPHGYSEQPVATHTLGLVNSDLDSEFFLKSHHQNYFNECGARKTDRFFWTVVEVRPTTRVEEVYCAVVPDYGSFVLEDNVWVGNCHTSFTVQVQPQMPAFPQTVNGMPIDVPGMPGGGDNAMIPPDSPAAQSAGQPPPGMPPASG